VGFIKRDLLQKGYVQRPGFDYDETFAPVAKASSIRTLFAIEQTHPLGT
jgi:hypothetical protein